MIIRKKIHGKQRDIFVTAEDCPKKDCFKPHDCVVQGAGGVRSSEERYVCLTNFHNGCPNIKRSRKVIIEMDEILSFLEPQFKQIDKNVSADIYLQKHVDIIKENMKDGKIKKCRVSAIIRALINSKGAENDN